MLYEYGLRPEADVIYADASAVVVLGNPPGPPPAASLYATTQLYYIKIFNTSSRK